VAHRGEKETVGAGCRYKPRQQCERILAVASPRSGPKGVVHQDRATADEMGARVVEHCLRLIAAPVVRVNRPVDELQPEPLGDTVARIGTDAPRRPPQPRAHPDALQRRQSRLTVVLKLYFAELGMADVTVTVKLYVVSGS
jgi:hypothetical protein